MLLEVEAKLQAGDAGADDTDAVHSCLTPLEVCHAPTASSARQVGLSIEGPLFGPAAIRAQSSMAWYTEVQKSW